MKTSNFFKCLCSCGGIHVEDTPWGVEFAYMHRNPVHRAWIDRIKTAWSALKGEPYSDMVILSKPILADLIDHLVEIHNLSPDDKEAERIEHIERCLFGVHCETAVDAIYKWLNSSDCSKRAYDRLKEKL